MCNLLYTRKLVLMTHFTLFRLDFRKVLLNRVNKIMCLSSKVSKGVVLVLERFLQQVRLHVYLS